MKNDVTPAEDFEDEPDCGIDAASDKGYWLEETRKGSSDYLFTWRKEAGLSPELLSKLAPIPLEDYLKIERGERAMTNGEAWRIDTAIINYKRSKETWFQRSWKRGWLARCRHKIRLMWDSDLSDPIILIAGLAILYFLITSLHIPGAAYIISFFLAAVLALEPPVFLAVWLALFIVKELRGTE